MNILQNAGTYEILTPAEWLAQQPLLIERAGRTAYQSYKCPECKGLGATANSSYLKADCEACNGTGNRPITTESAAKFIAMLIKRGHESVLEHSLLTVRFINCSRGMTHELVRHRLCAFTQESTRYVDERDTAVVAAPSMDVDEPIDVDSVLIPEYSMFTRREMYGLMAQLYKACREAGDPPQDARQFLPIGTTSEIVVSANLREWRHIFSLRCDKPAHWEIRGVMCQLLAELKRGPLAPLFIDFIPEDGWYSKSALKLED